MPDIKLMAGGAVLAGAAFWFFIKPNYLDAPAEPPVYTEEELSAAPRPTVTLEERVLNLKSSAQSPHYVKVQIAFEFADPERKWVGLSGEALVAKNEAFTKEMEGELYRVWDVVTTVIGSKTVDQASDPDGRALLKDELRDAVNAQIHEGEVETVYFVTFVTQ
jgi:flagellar basal body-associated protein FliL